jgi:hypothetical protein
MVVVNDTKDGPLSHFWMVEVWCVLSVDDMWEENTVVSCSGCKAVVHWSIPPSRMTLGSNPGCTMMDKPKSFFRQLQYFAFHHVLSLVARGHMGSSRQGIQNTYTEFYGMFVISCRAGLPPGCMLQIILVWKLAGSITCLALWQVAWSSSPWMETSSWSCRTDWGA